MKINGSIELYVTVFKGNSIALSTSISGKDLKHEGEYIKKYINVYLSNDFTNRDKVISKLGELKKGYYYLVEIEEGYLMPREKDDFIDVCLVISKCKFSKPQSFGDKKKSKKSSDPKESKDDDLPF